MQTDETQLPLINYKTVKTLLVTVVLLLHECMSVATFPLLSETVRVQSENNLIIDEASWQVTFPKLWSLTVFSEGLYFRILL